ncbi:hypothetical protein [Croceicoccus naphthovorans]|nr:hypothetical protein [Croceicoccus naphthovorans]MBB3990741.1 hypothetical protein [Croceicoccus naphthovorans]
MKEAGSARIILATAGIALSIMAVKTVLPAIPLIATVLASVLGLALIFSLYRSDSRTRRAASMRLATSEVELPTDADSPAIRARMETRPLPQIAPGPLTRVAPDAEKAAEPCTRDRVKAAQADAVLDLTPDMALSVVRSEAG